MRKARLNVALAALALAVAAAAVAALLLFRARPRPELEVPPPAQAAAAARPAQTVEEARRQAQGGLKAAVGLAGDPHHELEIRRYAMLQAPGRRGFHLVRTDVLAHPVQDPGIAR